MEPYEQYPEYSAVTYGDTPHGGVKTVAYFFDASGNRCREEDAASIQILEFDNNNTCVFSLIAEP